MNEQDLHTGGLNGTNLKNLKFPATDVLTEANIVLGDPDVNEIAVIGGPEEAFMGAHQFREDIVLKGALLPGWDQFEDRWRQQVDAGVDDRMINCGFRFFSELKYAIIIIDPNEAFLAD
jgi:hypothetical protein